MTVARRVVRLVDVAGVEKPKLLTARQLAQKKYKASERGRAAQARAKAKQMAKPEWKAKKREWSKAWRERNPVVSKVYARTYMRRWRRERQQGQGAAQ